MKSPKPDDLIFGRPADEFTAARLRAIREAKNSTSHHGCTDQFMFNAWRAELKASYGIDVSRMSDDKVGQLWGKGGRHIIITDHVDGRPAFNHCSNLLVFECTTYCIIKAVNGFYELNGSPVRFNASGVYGNFKIVAREHVPGQQYDSVIMFKP